MVIDRTQDIGYRTGLAEDLPAVRALLGECALPSDDLRPAHLEHFVIGRVDQRIVGTVGLEPLGEVALLRSLAVAASHRGRRVGHGLWARAREQAFARGIERLYLLTTTAEALFIRWGFHRIPRDQVAAAVQSTAEFRGMCPSTAIAMTIELELERTRLDRRPG